MVLKLAKCYSKLEDIFSTNDLIKEHSQSIQMDYHMEAVIPDHKVILNY